jgi:molecular chaperone DnaK (HSP70)
LQPIYIIGIDLGTTNSGMAFVQADILETHDLPSVSQFAIPQLVNSGEVQEEPLLPSSLFIPGPTDFPSGSLALPWDPQPEFVVGQLAQKRGAESPGRLVVSAKSWLCHAGVDRTAPILPQGAPEGIARLSPI